MNKFFALATVAVLGLASVSSAASIGAEGDGAATLAYDIATGNVVLQTDGQGPFTGIEIRSGSEQFLSDGLNSPGGLTTREPGLLGFDLLFNNFVEAGADFDLGNILPAGLSAQDLAADITVAQALALGSPAVPLDVIAVGIPEPTTFALLGLALVGFAGLRRRS